MTRGELDDWLRATEWLPLTFAADGRSSSLCEWWHRQDD